MYKQNQYCFVLNFYPARMRRGKVIGRVVVVVVVVDTKIAKSGDVRT